MSYYSVFTRFFLLVVMFFGSSLVLAAQEDQQQADAPEASDVQDVQVEIQVGETEVSVGDVETFESTPVPGDAAFTPLDKQDGPSLMQEGIKTVVMLLLLLTGFWWFSNWLKKSGKLARMAGSNGGIECLSVYSVGQKEKIALIRVKDQEFLVGITQTSIQPLHHFKQTGPEQTDSTEDKDAPSDVEFSKLLDKATIDP